MVSSSSADPTAWIVTELARQTKPCEAVVLFPGTDEERILQALKLTRQVDRRSKGVYLIPLISLGTTDQQRKRVGPVTADKIRQLAWARDLSDVDQLMIRALPEGETVRSQIRNALDALGQQRFGPNPRKASSVWLDSPSRWSDPPLQAKRIALVAPVPDMDGLLLAWSYEVRTGIAEERLFRSAAEIQLRPVLSPPDSSHCSRSRTRRDTLLSFGDVLLQESAVDDRLVFDPDGMGTFGELCALLTGNHQLTVDR